MAILTINGKEYTTRFEYKDIKKIESLYNGRSFLQIVENIGKMPSLTDLEIIIYSSIQDPELKQSDFSDFLDKQFSDPENDFSMDDLIKVFQKTLDESVFLKKMKKQQEKQEQKQQMKKAKIIK